MKWYTAGQDVSISIDIMVDGEYAVPDAGSITLTLRDNAGEMITGYDQKLLPDTILSTVTTTVLAAANGIGSSDFETRFVELRYEVGTRQYAQAFRYRLAPFLPIQATPEDIRGMLGATVVELPDDDIALVESYFILLDQYGEAFSTALLSGTIQSLYANRSIGLHAAIAQLPSLPSKLRQREKSNNSEFERMKVDFTTLRAALEKQLEESLTAALSLESTSTLPLLIALTFPTDVITGA